MAKRESVMLAHKYDPNKHYIGGWYWSEKLDGMRAIWDGGISRGMKVRDIPWANVEKDPFGRDMVSTGLWSRYYKSIQAPSWWIDELPINIPLDGELFHDDGFQKVSSVVRSNINIKESEWRKVRYFVFDSPPLGKLLGDGEINNPQFKKVLVGIREDSRFKEAIKDSYSDFGLKLVYLRKIVGRLNNDVVDLLPQNKLSYQLEEARKEVDEALDEVLVNGGEGIVLRNPGSIWVPERSKNLLKVKGINDAEGTVIGYIGGKGKLCGLFGALVLNYKGKRLELSGFTDMERRMMAHGENVSVPEELGGIELPDYYSGKYFQRGETVSFRYRELTDSGIPKEARYWRK